MKMPTTRQIRRAWDSVSYEYFVRRNKEFDSKQYEVCVTPSDAADPKVLGRYASREAAEHAADCLDDDARAKAVLALFKRCVAAK